MYNCTCNNVVAYFVWMVLQKKFFLCTRNNPIISTLRNQFPVWKILYLTHSNKMKIILVHC